MTEPAPALTSDPRPGLLLIRTIAEARAWVTERRGRGERVALVPTMGYLHPGHASLVEIARRSADRVAMSIFVNPLQFGPSEDFARYPRDLDRDLRLAAAAGVDLVFAPAGEEMYPRGAPGVVVAPEVGADVLCGRQRPGHFQGVLTVVAKLFGIFTPDVAVFGQKDYQQLSLIRRMVADLEMPIGIEGGPTAREPDGLAMSSRNRLLSPAERDEAAALSAALRDCLALFRAGERDPAAFRRRMQRAAGAGISLEYAEVVDPLTLESLAEVVPGAVCALAAKVGGTRLIDNIILDPATLL